MVDQITSVQRATSKTVNRVMGEHRIRKRVRYVREVVPLIIVVLVSSEQERLVMVQRLKMFKLVQLVSMVRIIFALLGITGQVPHVQEQELAIRRLAPVVGT